MIISIVDYLKCDVVMTIDDNTFLPLCNEVDYYCCSCKKSKFNSNDVYIFEYNG